MAMTPQAFLAAHASNPERCDPACPGWFINSESGLTNRCDECWSHYPEDDQPCDGEAAAARVEPNTIVPRMLLTSGEPVSIGMLQEALAKLGLAILPVEELP
jgi:hypothetical protein